MSLCFIIKFRLDFSDFCIVFMFSKHAVVIKNLFHVYFIKWLTGNKCSNTGTIPVFTHSSIALA